MANLLTSRSMATSASSPTDSFTFADETIDTPLSSADSVSALPIEDEFLALGTITLQHHQPNDDSQSQLMMRSPTASEPYPNPWMSTALRKGWLRVDEMNSKSAATDCSYLRVYVLPEDVNRSNRGSIKDFRKTIKHLLSFVNRSIDAWLGIATSLSTYEAYEVPKSACEESLFYIFNTLRSPSPNLDCFRFSSYGYQSVNDVMNDSILGLKTKLYPYQQRSIAAMIQRESEPAKILDPRKPVYRDIYGRSFYLDISDGVLVRNAPLYTEPQGGILAETMGYGKTLICIALILATKGHYPKVPEDRVDSIPFQSREKVGSLLSIAARRTKQEGVPWKMEFYALNKAGYQFDRCLEELKKYEREYAEPIFTPTTPDRKGKRESANIVRTCSATLIIVPPNLLIQWQHEIEKHTEEDALEVLCIDSPSKELPPWQELLNFDIVLITKARFEQEYRDDDLNQGRSRKGEARYRSPLTELRWLRVICDEGHGFAGSSSRTNAIAMLDKMFIERRWVVSGTPSSTLHGVEVGLSTTDSFMDESHLSHPQLDATSIRKNSVESALQKRRTPSARDIEIKDLERLRLIVVNFLRLQPWANQRGSSDVANWNKYLAPFMDVTGQQCTSPALRDVLQTLIIRHRIEDIDTDLSLPPLHNKIVYLQPSYHDKLAINMFFLVLTSNYVTSEREDEDYMFHPNNRKKLDQLINNLRQASFHWIGFSEHDIRETLRISNEYLNKNIDTISDADGALLTEAILNGERALADPSWRAFASLHEIGVYVRQFPEHARDTWALDARGDDPVLLGTVQAREAQKYLQTKVKNGSEDVLAGFAGAGIRAMNVARHRAENEQKAQQKAKEKLNESEKTPVGASEEPKLKPSGASSASFVRPSPVKHSSPSTSQKRRRSLSEKPTQLATPPSSPLTKQKPRLSCQLSSTLSDTVITSFTSSKLTYLVSRLLNLPSSTKSLVFYQHNNTAFFIAEALELFSIPFRIYANTLSVAQRNAYLAEFNSESSDLKVLLMDIKQASHGLHVACASYVCIVSPIWDAGVESQAIKRAHRIGQTQEVVVETLVLQGTFEEEMVRRRKWKDEHLDLDHDSAPNEQNDADNSPALTNMAEPKKGKLRNSGTRKGLLDDRHMVNVIKEIQFLKFGSDEESSGGRVNEMNVPTEKRRLFGQLLARTHALADGTYRDGNNDALVDVKKSAVNKAIDESGLRAKFQKLHTQTYPRSTFKMDT